MAFVTEPEPPHGVKLRVLPGIARIVAANPSVMTYHGTNTWLIDGPDGTTVIDPGPDDAAHVAAVLAAAGTVARIVLTHTHADHLGATAALRAAAGAPVFAWRVSESPGFAPDHALDDGDAVAGMTALHTPGHAGDHLCFARPDGVLFSGDHVMGWNSSIVNPPKGVMADYFASLRRLLARDGDRVYLCGHGPVLENPHPFVEALLAHRVKREQEIAAALSAEPVSTAALTDRLYSQTHRLLRMAAERNVIAHLLKLQGEGVAAREGELWRLAA
jgi:glyoxylase-like metal-dependent hydrolase (beta-lactamase superfamily II)